MKSSSWKGKSLSTAGRVTLAKSVLSSLPMYTINSLRIPDGVSETLDRITRALYGGGVLERAGHFTLCLGMKFPKRTGGLGIQPTREMNLAALGKLGWKMINGEVGAWWEILTANYGVSFDDGQICESKATRDSMSGVELNEPITIMWWTT
ncbi:LOW QUALITY PROTEIN: hypothetical protein V2J09_013796 [Rumex salicifolius]